jgi:ATP-dependent DNA helicase RecQ
LSVQPGQERVKKIVQYIKSNPDKAGIVYCLSRASTQDLSNALNRAGISSKYYHAQMEADERSRVQDEFLNDEVQVICATIAFGMGVDKSNIRFVIHYNMPKNIESYYQEIGRAGRDGLPAEALMFYSYQDYSVLRELILNGEAEYEYKQLQIAKMDRMLESASTTGCRTNLLLNYFGEFRSDKCNHCDNCLNPKDTFDGTILAQKAISAVVRCREDLTTGMLIDVLRGVKNDLLTKKGYDMVKTFGVGRDRFAMEWKLFINQMINQGIFSIDFSNYNKLKLTPLSQEVLSSKLKVNLEEAILKPSKDKSIKNRKIMLTKKPEVIENDNSILGKLKKWRTQKAKEAGMPPYIIMHDSVLEKIAEALPSNLNELSSISGIGEHKLNKYGHEIIDLLN